MQIIQRRHHFFLYAIIFLTLFTFFDFQATFWELLYRKKPKESSIELIEPPSSYEKFKHFKELPTPVIAHIIYFSYLNDLKERYQCKKKFHFAESRLIKRTNSEFIETWQHPKFSGFLTISDIKKFFFVGWQNPEHVKLFIEQIEEVDETGWAAFPTRQVSYQNILIDYGFKNNSKSAYEIVEEKNLPKDERYKGSIQLVTLSRDKKKLFTLEYSEEIWGLTKGDETLQLVVRQRENKVDQWKIKQTHSLSLGLKSAVDMAYFEEFDTVGFLHVDEQAVTPIKLTGDIINTNAKTLVQSYLHKKVVCK